MNQIWMVLSYETKLFIYSLSLSLPSSAPLCLWTLLVQRFISNTKTVYFESSRLFSVSPKMPCGVVTAQGCFGVSSVSSEKWRKWNKTIENLPCSFVLIRTQGLASLKVLSWLRQDPPITIWLLFKSVDFIQARLGLPGCKGLTLTFQKLKREDVQC